MTDVRNADVSVYRNPTGALAVSLDDDRIILPSGRLVEVGDAWEPSDEDFDADALTPAARQTLDRLYAVRAEVRLLAAEGPTSEAEPPRQRRRKVRSSMIWLSPELLKSAR